MIQEELDAIIFASMLNLLVAVFIILWPVSGVESYFGLEYGF